MKKQQDEAAFQSKERQDTDHNGSFSQGNGEVQRGTPGPFSSSFRRLFQEGTPSSEAHAAAWRELYRTLFHAAGDAVFVYPLEPDGSPGPFIEVNEVACRRLGYSRDELLHLTVHDLMVGDVRVEAVLRRLQTDGTLVIEAEHLSKEGRLIPVEVSAHRFDLAEQPIVLSLARDISERRQAEAARARLAAIVESSDDAIISKTLDRVITSWNAAAEHMYGYTAAEAVGQSIDLIIPPERREELTVIMRTLARGERVEPFETVRVAKDGQRIDVSLTVSPVIDKAGTIVGASAIARDITERRQAEQELRRSRQELQDFVENAVLGLHWVGPDGTILWANQAELDMLGYTREEYVGQHIAAFHVDQPVIEEILQCLSDREELHNYEARMRAKDGSIRHVLISSNVYWKGDQFVHTRCFTRDITERKQAEQETHLLAEAGQVLAASLDYEETLRAVAGLLVPALVDWCTIHVLTPEESIEQVAVAHTDPDKVRLANELHRRYPAGPVASHGVAHVLRTGQPEFLPVVEEELIRDFTQDEEHVRLIKELGLYSAMVVPLVARGRALGALTLVNAEKSQRFTKKDLAFAEELARRCALSVENARLYREAKKEIARRKAAQEALHESERLLRFTLAATRVGTWNWDRQTDQVEWSENLEAIHRMAPGSFDGTFEAFFEDVAPEDREHVQQAIEEAFQRGGDYQVEYRLPPKDEEDGVVWVEGKGTVLFDEQGEPVRMVGICMDITERKQAEKQLRDSMELFRQLVLTSPAALYTTDSVGRVTLFNDRAAELWGREPEIGQDMWCGSWRIYEPDGTLLPHDQCPMAIALREGRGINGQEIIVERPDGARAHVLAYPEPLRNAAGELVGAVNMLIDVSELKQTEQALRQKTHTLETINEINTSLAAHLDLEQLVQAVTDAGTELSGAEYGAFFYTAPDAEDESYVLYALSGVSQEAVETFPRPRNMMLTPLTFRNEGIVRVDDVTRDPHYGQDVPYEGMPEGHLPVRSYLAVPVVGRSGKTLGGLFFGHSKAGVFTEQVEDIVGGIASQAAIAVENARLFDAARRELEERRRIQQALQESEARFRMMADTAPALIWMAGLDKHYTYFNNVWLEFTGRTLEEELGFGWAEEVHPDDVERRLDRYTTAFDAREPFDVEYRLRRHDGVYRWILDHGTPRFTPEQGFAGYIGSCIDITERKAAETQLKAINETLEQRVSERTAELENANTHLTREITERRRAERELEQTNELLTQRNRELQDFAYVASHDLQEPLRKISAFSDLIRADYGDALKGEGLDYLNRMQKAALRMSGLINDLLAFSRIATQGRSFEPIDVTVIVNDVLSDLEVSIQEAGGRVKVEPLPTLEADPTQMRQLFQNLISNAIKFRRDGVPPVVRVAGSVEPGAEAGASSLVHLTVTDNGIGFEEQFYERIFAPFQRLHGRSAYAGSGIGLAICRRIVERHGGTITASSTLGEGSTFRVTLPVRHAS